MARVKTKSLALFIESPPLRVKIKIRAHVKAGGDSFQIPMYMTHKPVAIDSVNSVNKLKNPLFILPSLLPCRYEAKPLKKDRAIAVNASSKFNGKALTLLFIKWFHAMINQDTKGSLCL